MKSLGEVVAFAGTEDSDVASMVFADLSICLNIYGTEEAKSAALLIIMDDSFCSIVKSFNHVRRRIWSSFKH